VASLHFIVCWIGYLHVLSFCRSYSFCPTAVSRMLEMNTHVGFSVSYTEFTAYVKQRKVGGGTVCWVWHYYLNLVFQASCMKVITEQKILQKQTLSMRCGSPFLCTERNVYVSTVRQFVWNSSKAIKIAAVRSTNDLNNKQIHNVDQADT